MLASFTALVPDSASDLGYEISTDRVPGYASVLAGIGANQSMIGRWFGRCMGAGSCCKGILDCFKGRGQTE